MIHDTLSRQKFNGRLARIADELEELDKHTRHLPFEQVCRFHNLTKELRAFVETNGHDHD